MLWTSAPHHRWAHECLFAIATVDRNFVVRGHVFAACKGSRKLVHLRRREFALSNVGDCAQMATSFAHDSAVVLRLLEILLLDDEFAFVLLLVQRHRHGYSITVYVFLETTEQPSCLAARIRQRGQNHSTTLATCSLVLTDPPPQPRPTQRQTYCTKKRWKRGVAEGGGWEV